MKNTLLNDVEINQKLTEIVDKSFISFEIQKVVEFVNALLPKFNIAKENKFVFSDDNFFTILDKDNIEFPLDSIEIKNEKITISVFKDGHIQITERNKDFFISKDELKTIGMDRDSSFIIGNGIRGLDPYDQKNWVKTAVGSEWPTSFDTRNPSGVINLFTDKNNKSIMFTSPKNVGQNYGTNPRGMVIPDDDSIIIIFQQENNNPDLKFAAWSILPFKVPEGKKAIALFPYNEKENYECVKSSSQYKIKDGFVILDASEKGGMADHISKNVDAVLYTIEDSLEFYLMRSVYKEKESNNDKFKTFSLGGSDCKYIELEFIAPQVNAGEKSTLAYKLESISLDSLNKQPFSFQNIEDEAIKLFNQIK